MMAIYVVKVVDHQVLGKRIAFERISGLVKKIEDGGWNRTSFSSIL